MKLRVWGRGVCDYEIPFDLRTASFVAAIPTIDGVSSICPYILLHMTVWDILRRWV